MKLKLFELQLRKALDFEKLNHESHESSRIICALPTLAGNSVVMLSKAKHPSGETLTINATGIPHCVRNDKFPVKAGRAEIGS